MRRNRLATTGLAAGAILLITAAASGGPEVRRSLPRVAPRRSAPALPFGPSGRLLAAPRGIEVRKGAEMDPKILAAGDPGIDPGIIAPAPEVEPAPVGGPSPLDGFEVLPPLRWR